MSGSEGVKLIRVSAWLTPEEWAKLRIESYRRRERPTQIIKSLILATIGGNIENGND